MGRLRDVETGALGKRAKLHQVAAATNPPNDLRWNRCQRKLEIGQNTGRQAIPLTEGSVICCNAKQKATDTVEG